MLAFINSFALFAEGGSQFYNEWLNIPGFEAWKFLNLAVFVAILVYLLKKPVSQAFKEKREAIRADLIKAEEDKKNALSRLTEIEGRLAQLETEKANIIKRAQEEAAAEKDRISEQTRLDVERLRQQTESELARLGHQVKSELRRFSAEESIRLATEKLRVQVDAKNDARLIKAGIQEIGGLN